MTRHFTQADTIRFVYNEMTKSESNDYLSVLDSNEKICVDFCDLIGLLSEIDNSLNVGPSDNCVDNILKYASFKQSKSVS